MSNQISSNLPKYYIYKLYFKSGKTYVGQHTQRREDDRYVTSSFYYRDHKDEDPLEKREILLEVKDLETLNIMETVCIMHDKAENGKQNVNGNLGGYVSWKIVEWTPERRKKVIHSLKEFYKTHSNPRKGKHMSKSSKAKMIQTKLNKHYHPTKETIQKANQTRELQRKNHLEEYKNRYEKNKKYHWFNNGQIDKFLLEKHESWFEGRLKGSKFANKKRSKGRAWNNGEFETISVNCPQEGWIEGRLQNPKNKHLRKCIICEETGKMFQDRFELFDYLNGEFELASLTPKIRKRIPVNGFTYRYLEA